MRRIRHDILHTLYVILFFCARGFAQTQYDPGDWVSYRNFRDARALDASTHDVFIATSGGILQYQLFRQTWTEPMAVGFALSEAVDLDDPQLLLFDEQTNYLWVATRTQLLQYDVTAERWTRIHRNLWGPADRVVNLGVGGNDLYLETLPAALYARLFLPGSPLPLADWEGFATRYRGSRAFGSLMPDLGNDPNTESVRWRGLRSKRPLTARELFGSLGLPPVNFPAMLLPDGWTWRADGTLIDTELRGYPITDWLVDRAGFLWASFDGGGVLRGDLRAGRVELYGQGPAGNDIRALAVAKDLWMGGLESGDNRGITHASADLGTWRFYEPRDNSRIRSTETFDIARFSGSVWFATQEGLLEFQEKAQRWRLFTVGEGLPSNEIRALAASDSVLWIGTASGLCALSKGESKVTRVPIPQTGLTGVLDLLLVGPTLYVSTTFGFYQTDVHTRVFAPAPLDPALLNAPVLDMAVSPTEVWAATAEGIQRINTATGELKAWPGTDWMAGALPTSIALAGRYVWIGTSERGFYRFNRESGEWISYTTADGLIDNHVWVLRPDGDDLWIGTAGGLTRFYWNRPNRPR